MMGCTGGEYGREASRAVRTPESAMEEAREEVLPRAGGGGGGRRGARNSWASRRLGEQILDQHPHNLVGGVRISGRQKASSSLLRWPREGRPGDEIS